MLMNFTYDTECPQFNKKNDVIDFGKFPRPKEPAGCVFQDFGILDLSKVTMQDLEQLHTREQGDKEDKRIESIEDSYETFDFITDVEPPKINTLGQYLEGIGRFKAAMKRGEPSIPVAIFKQQDTSKGSRLSIGLIENNPTPNNSKTPNTLKEWSLTIRGLVELGPKQGGIINTTASVMTKLSELDWEKRWPRKSTRTTLKQMIDRELESLRNKDTMVHRINPSEIKDWLHTNYSGFSYLPICADNERYARSIIFDHVFKAVKSGSDPLLVVLFSKRHTSSIAIKNVKNFVEYLDKLYMEVFEHVGIMQLRDPKIAKWLSQFVNPPVLNEMNPVRPYEIIGCVPQIEGYHNIDGNKLVKIEDYGKKKPNIMKKSTKVSDFMTIDTSLGV